MRLAFLGSGAFGIPTLSALRERHELALIVSQPDKPAGRGRVMTPTPVAEWAVSNAPGVPLMKPADINTADMVAQVRSLAGPGKIDAWVVIAFGQKLSEPLVEGVFAINLHASLLPRWRGAAPINAAILAGDAITGNSVITIANRMDAGLILGRSERPIEARTTAGELHDLLAADGPRLVLDVLDRHARGVDEATKQDEAQVTRAKKLSKADGAIEFSREAELIRRRVHGLTPWPGVTVTLKTAGGGSTTIKLLRVAVDDAAAGGTVSEPGTIINACSGVALCGGGTALRLIEVQPAGGRAMAWADFARGHAVAEGSRLSSAAEPA